MIMIRNTMSIVGFALVVTASLARGQVPTTSTAPIMKQPVTFRSHDLALLGYLFKPEGDGPFPAVLWNHGSERAPGRGQQFDSVAAIFLRAGYVIFAPVRRGHEGSEGPYIVDEIKRTRASRGPEEANRLVVRKLETEQLDDQLAGLAYLRRLPFVDPSRIVVAGCSYV